MNITVKSIPPELGAALKRAAVLSNRSLNGEIIHRLRGSLLGGGGASGLFEASPDGVADAWQALAGRWRSDLSVEDEIAALYAQRSAGRNVDVTW